MVRLFGLGDDDRGGFIAWFERLVTAALRRVAAFTARLLDPRAVTLDDLNVIRPNWAAAVDAGLLPGLAEVFTHAAAGVTDGLTAIGVGVSDLASPDAAAFMAAARNRLVGVGDLLWQAARDELTAGIRAGDDMQRLAARVAGAAGLSEDRARLVARTEVISVMNFASITQVRMLGDRTVRKEWLATAGLSGMAGTCDERTRPTHCKADGQRVLIGARFNVGAAFLDYPGDPTGPADETVNCLPGRQPVSVRATALVMRAFDGMLIQITTADGDELAATPNHPVLTRRGWQPIGAVHPGDYVLCCTDPGTATGSIDPDVAERNPTAEQVAGAIQLAAGGGERVTAALVDLDGETLDPHVHVVRTELPLTFGRHTEQLDQLSHLSVHRSHREVRPPRRTSAGNVLTEADLVGFGGGPSTQVEVFEDAQHHVAGNAEFLGHTQNGGVGCIEASNLVVVESAALGGRPRRESVVLERLGDHPLGDAKLAGDPSNGQSPLLVELDDAFGHTNPLNGLGSTGAWHRVTSRIEEAFAGTIYDFESPAGLFSAGGIVVANCRCSMAFDLDDEPSTVALTAAKSAYDEATGTKRDGDGKFAEHDTGGGADVLVSPFPGMLAASTEDRAAFRERTGRAIPPAWTDVYIAEDIGSAKLLVRGKDGKGRGQSIYSAAHTQAQAAAKFVRVRELVPHIGKLDHALERDAEDDDSAAALLLIRRLGMRPGSDRDTGARQQAHGATNLRARHVTVDGDTVGLDFIGKEGVHIQLQVTDPLIASAVKRRLDRRSGDDRLFDTDENRTREYMRSAGVPADFMLKDLRTLHANVVALRAVRARGDAVPQTKTEFRKWRNDVGDQVSAELGNTRALALSSYVNPTVFGSWATSEEWL